MNKNTNKNVSANKITNTRKQAGMLTFHFANNFGAALQTYALQYNENYYKLSKRCSNSQGLKKLPLYDCYICGSDQIWNDMVTLGSSPEYFLQFAPEQAAKISYAPSFGSDISDEKKLDRIAELLKAEKIEAVFDLLRRGR